MAEAYPTIPAGRRLTAALLRSMLPQTVRKTADDPRAATTTFADDPHLTFAVEAGGVYRMNGAIKYFADPTPDLKVQFTSPTGTLGEWWWNMPGSGTATTGTTGYSIRTETNDFNGSRTGYGTSDSIMFTPIGGLWRIGSTAGSITLQWAQNTSNATATTLYTDSYLEFRRIA
ncbi:hypothetical protein PV355_01410 [Streptomyces stelliscabiei]|uniref:hypothetical protein n=1 Tax=Streptomyces stelliscabiei TaxID=146820 RepID=UPI00299FA3AA|nr:hypothetical protein [Streptomyces stelliscabiei]MDX2513823.1 hypothetical protein [Streptomyces stelliscabiei]